tara:strand:- start:1309 stop:2703 length:1395 start_codon:yes stop_codon:yes gene_type:complete
MTDPDDLKPEGDPVRPRFGAQPDDQKSEGKEKEKETGKDTATAAKKGETAPVAAKSRSRKPRPNWALRGLLLLVLFLAGAAVAIYFLPDISARLPVIDRWLARSGGAGTDQGLAAEEIRQKLAQQDQRLATLQDQFGKLELRLEALEEKSQSGQLSSVPDSTLQNEIPLDNIPVDDILARLEALEKAVETPAQSETDLSQSARIDMLLSRMSQLEASFVPLSKGLIEARDAAEERQNLARETKSQAEWLAQLEGRLDRLERAAAREASDTWLAFRLSRLKDRVLAGQPYQETLTHFQEALGEGPLTQLPAVQDALDRLQRHAGEGVAPLDDLRRTFDTLVPTVLRAATHVENGSWWDRLLSRLRGLITVRDRAPKQGGVHETLLKIEQALAQKTPEHILDLIPSLPAEAKRALESWEDRLRVRLEAEAALANLENIIGESLFQPAPATPKAPRSADPAGEGVRQ